MRNCYFCEEGMEFSSAKKRLPADWPYEDEIIYYDKYIFSIVGSGPQTVPYILILPKRHIFSLAQMNHEEWQSFIRCLDFLVNKGGYGDELCIFEHGGESKGGSSSIDHCHVHVIKGELGLYYRNDFKDFLCIRNVKDNSCLVGEHYLLIGKYKNAELEIKLAPDFETPEHQYFRRMLARQLNEEFWDWRENRKETLMLETMNKFKGI